MSYELTRVHELLTLLHIHDTIFHLTPWHMQINKSPPSCVSLLWYAYSSLIQVSFCNDIISTHLSTLVPFSLEDDCEEQHLPFRLHPNHLGLAKFGRNLKDTIYHLILRVTFEIPFLR